MAKTKEAILIFNPNSGRGKGKKRAVEFQKAWGERFGNELQMRATRSKEDICAAAQESADSKLIQIFMGGDGTISEALQGLAKKSKFKPLRNPVGILPSGSGNSFLRDFQITEYSVAQTRLLDAIEKRSIRKIDMGMLEFNPSTNGAKQDAKAKRIIFNIFGIGLMPIIAELAMKMRFLGSLNYTFATLIKLVTHKSFAIDAKIDSKKKQPIVFDFLSICNSKFTGGAMIMAPEVEVDDGKLYLVAPNVRRRLKILMLFPKIFSGDHLNDPKVLHHFLKSIEMTSPKELLMLIDGELEYGYDPFISVVPKYWQLFMN